MASPQQFRAFADTCVQMAQETGRSDHRARLIDMAEEWRRLADEAERFDRLVRDLDEAFDRSIAPEPSSRMQRRSH